MFHAFDKEAPGAPPQRRAWMALLARAPAELLERAVGAHAGDVRWLRRPETGLMMVQGRAGGTAERFNLGEITVTRCVLRLAAAQPQAAVGVAYVLGRSHRQAQLAAVADALLQVPAWQADVEASLLQPVRQHLRERAAQARRRAQNTRVEFFTMAREAGGGDGSDSEEDEA